MKIANKGAEADAQKARASELIVSRIEYKMNQLDIYQGIESAVKGCDYECMPRGSLEKGSFNEFSDIDVQIKGVSGQIEDIKKVIRLITEIVGLPADIRFDADENTGLLFSIHSYKLPILWRIDVIVDCNVSDASRVIFGQEFPCYNEWHDLMKKCYKMKQNMRLTSACIGRRRR